MSTKLTYRPEIDGLRAIAVFSVIFYHAEAKIFGKDFFTGGYIGVDIFFVISGYLITSLILKELKINNNFSFLNFYERRIRRIIPALFTVILVTMPFAWFYLLPIDLIDVSKSALYTLGFSSNYYFYFSDIQYNAADSLLKPFLHTWSLSVEEQYYIIFPVILLFSFRFFQRYLFQIIIAVLLISLYFSDISSKENVSLTFYSLHTRMWELLAGSLLAYFEIKKQKRSNNKILNQFLPIFGLILIFYSFLFFKDSIFHPSLITVIPIFGVCLVIWFSNKNGFMTNILSSKIFVGTGLISYSLYLWHFPIFVFAKIMEFTQGDLLRKLFLIVIAIILSKITFVFIEKKFRNKKIISIKNLFYILFSVFLLLIVSNAIILNNNGFKNRIPEILQNNISVEFPWKILKDDSGQVCYKKINNHCVFNKKGIKEVFIVGDSHVASLALDLKEKLIKKNYQVNVFTIGGCWYLPDFDKFDKKTRNIDTNCNSTNQNKIRKKILETKNSIVIIGGRLPVYLSSKYFNNKEGGVERRLIGEDFGYFQSVEKKIDLEEGIKISIQELLDNNHKVITIYPIPEVGWDVPKKLNSKWVNRHFDINSYQEKITTSFKVFNERTKDSFKLLNELKHRNLYRVYPHRLFCNNQILNRCITHNDKDVFYADDDHPSKIGSELINNLIIDEVEKIETN